MSAKVSSLILSEKNEPYELYIAIDGDLPKAMNKVMSSHWAKNGRDAKKWKTLSGTAALIFRPEKPLTKCNIRIVRHNYRMLDYDGLVASMKPLVDGLKDIVIKDDSWGITGKWDVDQVFRPKSNGSLIEIWIKETV